jgi:3-phenylpropionate/trans-cinnamate dioxygenase ferredoxin reductase subunit
VAEQADVVIVGAGAAGHACAEELRAQGFGGSVVVVGRDLDPPYERPLVSKGRLAGTATREETLLPALDVDLRVRTSAMKLDAGTRTLKLVGGELEWSRGLVLCTGANVRRLRVDGAALEGIHYLRALANADALRAAAAPGSRAVLVGGSYIACEVAATLTGLGVACTMVMLEDAPLSGGFGPEVGEWAAQLLRSHGVELVCGDGLERFEGAERVERVITASGRVVDADLVVMGTGAVPDAMLARAGGLTLGETGGIACDATLQAAPGIWAAGDACEFAGRRIEHWEVARAQGACAARNVLGAGEAFSELPYFWTDLADWATLEYVGGGAWDTAQVRGSMADGSFSVFYRAGERLVAALACDRGADLDEARALLAG